MLHFWVRSFLQYRAFAEEVGQMGNSLKGKSHICEPLGQFSIGLRGRGN
jgi:hypothetical protein